MEYEGVPIRAHLDFVLVQQKPPVVRIVEVKSMTRLPDTLHAAHERKSTGKSVCSGRCGLNLRSACTGKAAKYCITA